MGIQPLSGDYDKTPAEEASSGKTQEAYSGNVSFVGENALGQAIAALFGLVDTVISAAKVYGDAVQWNAQLQEQKNKQIMTFKLAILPNLDGLSDSQRNDIINNTSVNNQNVQFQKQSVQSIVITLRQQGKKDLATVQVNINQLQQSTSALTQFLKIISAVSELINRLSNPE